VHALPSLHEVPFAATGFEHTPVLGLQVPATWHASLAVHVTPAQLGPPEPAALKATICPIQAPSVAGAVAV
jgi:hypothetical protein